jgi:hypothetical protein
MPLEIAGYLREIARKCAQLARDCPDPHTARKLEEFSDQVMVRATEFKAVFTVLPLPDDSVQKNH